jgi:hypothetical protein
MPAPYVLSYKPGALALKLLSRAGVFAFCFALACYAASWAVTAGRPLRNGSYTSPLTHSRCSNTANFRATATAARFFAFFPPRSHSRSPYRRKSVSGPNGPKM